MTAFGSGKNTLNPCKHLCRLEYLCLLNASCLHKTVVVKLAEYGAHTVVAKSACVVCRRNEAAAEGIHLGKRTNHSRVAEIVCKLTSCEARTACRLNCDDLIISLASELFAHERRNKSAEVGAAACTADDRIGLNAVFIHSDLRFKSDNRLMKKHLIENASEDIAVALVSCCDLDRLADSAAETARCAGMLCKYLSADLCFHARAGSNRSAVCSHYLTAERLLLIGAFNHIYLTVKSEIGASHTQRSTPLTCSGFCCNAFKSLLLCVICLSDCAVELVASACVVALKLIIDLCRSAKLLFQAIGSNKRRRTVHLVETENLFGNVKIRCVVVKLLLDKLVAENGTEVFKSHRLMSAGVEKRSRLVLHIGTNIVPLLRHFLFIKVDFVRNFFCVAHNCLSFSI